MPVKTSVDESGGKGGKRKLSVVRQLSGDPGILDVPGSQQSQPGDEIRDDDVAVGLALKKSMTLTMRDLKINLSESMLTIVVFGASGHLAKTKTYPALFELYKLNTLPDHTAIVGYARSNLNDEQLRERVGQKFSSDPKSKDFLKICTYHRGSYDKVEDFELLDKHIGDLEEKRDGSAGTGNRLFYYALPPNLFGDVSRCIKTVCMSEFGWNRVIIEKPFGKDSKSAQVLQDSIGSYLNEDEVFRIDHYLAKELIQNIIVLRFSNPIMREVWSRKNVSAVKISIKEDAGVDGRGGYYDTSGCIRDVIQNHLLQVLSLVAMEQPKSLGAEHIRDAKVAVLKHIKAPGDSDEVVVGQYSKNDTLPGYLDDETVPNDSNTETFCQMVLYIDNDRWRGVPFICKAGKALEERRAEIRMQFRQPGDSLYPSAHGNELVMRIQPDEALWLRVNAKTPGLSNINNLVGTELDLSYQQRFNLQNALPGAYTRLILDVLRGEHALFVRADELMEAWRIVNEVITAVAEGKLKAQPYVRGSRGPKEADEIAMKYWKRQLGYNWPLTKVSGKSKSPEATEGAKGNA